MKREPNLIQNLFILSNEYVGGWKFLFINNLISSYFRNESYSLMITSIEIENRSIYVLLGLIIFIVTSWIQIVVIFKRSKSTGDGFKIIEDSSNSTRKVENTSNKKRLLLVILCVLTFILFELLSIFTSNKLFYILLFVINLSATIGWGFSNGKPHGVIDSWYPSGNLQSTSNYFNGLKHGYSITYFENGNTKKCGKFSDGKEIDKWEFYNEDGSLDETKFYEVTRP